jgi:hypothetical protein
MARSSHRPGVGIATRTQRNTLRHSFGHGCRDVHRNQAIRPAATATTPIAIAPTTELDSANSTVRTVRLPRGGIPIAANAKHARLTRPEPIPLEQIFQEEGET